MIKISYKEVKDFKPAIKKKEKINFINFGSEGEPFIVHIKSWEVYEMPPLVKEWRNTFFIFDVEGRGIRINATGFQEQLKEFWGKKASLTIQRWIPRDEDGDFITSATKYKVTQFNEASLWSYEEPN